MGHYCMVCGNWLANEKFSGKGHRRHVCKACSKKPLDERNDMITLNRIYGLYNYPNLSKNNKRMLKGYLNSGSEKVREAAKAVQDHFKSDRKNARAEEFDWIDDVETDIGQDENYDRGLYIDDEEIPF